MKISDYILVLSVILIAGCSGSRSISQKSTPKDEALAETYYYKMFTDATKHALFGNYKSAIGLYNACVKEFPERAAPYYQLSSIYLRGQEFELAKTNAIKAVQRDTGNIWYILQLANIYQYGESYDSAAVMYEKALDIKPDPELKYNLAILYSRSGNNDAAIELLDELNSRNEGSKEILVMKHNVYHAMKDYDAAIKELEILTRYFPNDPSVYGILAEYLTEIGRNNYARKVYTDLMERDPENGLVLLSFAEFYARNNDLDSAYIYYSRAFCCSDLNYDNKISVGVNFIVQPDFIQHHNSWVIDLLDTIPRENIDFRLFASYADIFINLEEYDKALPYIDSALILEKKNYMLWEQALLLNNYQSNYQKVIMLADSAYSFFPDEPNVFFISALGNNALKNYEDALNDLDSVANNKPPAEMKIQALNLRAEIYRNLEMYAESDSIFEKILELDPENLMIRNNYGYYLSLREENLERAKELSEITIIKEPENATYLDTYGWILFKMGEVKEAKKFIERAIRNGAYNNAEVLDHYGEIMFELDNCAEAIEAWEKVVEVDSTYSLGNKLTEARRACE